MAIVQAEQRLKRKAQRLMELSEEADARQQQLPAVLDSASAAVISVDSSFRITLFNKAAEVVFRVSAAQIIGRRIDDLVPERNRPGHAVEMPQFDTRRASHQR